MDSRTVFLTRKEYDATLPWTPEFKIVVSAAKKTASLAGFSYTFPNVRLAQEFKQLLQKGK